MKRTVLRFLGLAAMACASLGLYADGNVAKIGTQEYATLKAAVDAAQSGDVIRILADGVVFDAAELGALEKDITLNLNFKQFSFTKAKLDLSKGHLTIAGFGIVSGMIQTTKPEDQTRVFVRSGFFPKLALLPILKQEGNPDGWIDLPTMLTMTRPAYPVTDYSQDGDPMQERFYVEDGFLPKIGDDGKLVLEGSNYSNKHIANSETPSYNVIPLPKSTITKMTLDEFAKGLAENGGSIENFDKDCVARLMAMSTPVYAFSSYEDDAMKTAFENMVTLFSGTKFDELFALAQSTDKLSYQEYAMGMCKFSNWFADYSIEFDAAVSEEDINSGSPTFIGAYGWGGVQVCRNIPGMEAGQKHYLVKNYMSTQDSFTYCLVTSLVSPFLCTTVDMLDDPNVSGKCKQYGKTVTVQLRIQNPNATNFDSNGERESILISQCRYTYGKGVIAKVGDQVFTLDEVNAAIAAKQLQTGMTVKLLNDIDASTKITGINAEMTIEGNGFMVSDGAFETAPGYKVVDNGNQTWSVVFDPSSLPICKIAETGAEFSTLEAAYAAVQPGQTIKLLGDAIVCFGRFPTAVKTLADGEMVRLACEEGAVSDYYDYANLVEGAKGCTLTVAALEGGRLVEIASRIAAGDVQAQVGGKSYADVESAVEAVRESGGTGSAKVEVTSSEDLGDKGIVVADVPAEITLDLGGVTTGNESDETPTLAVSGSVVRVTGEAEGGALVNAKPGGVVIEARSGAKVTVESGFYDGLLVCAGDAELVVEGGTFTRDPRAFVNPDESVVTRRTDPATGSETFTVSAKEVDLRVTPAAVAAVALAVVDEDGNAVAAPDEEKVAEANAAAKAAAIAEIVSNVTTEGSVETGVLDERLVMDALASGPALKAHVASGLTAAMETAKSGASDGMKAAIEAAQADLSREIRNRVDASFVGVGTEVTKAGEAYAATVTRETFELTPMAKVTVTAPVVGEGGEPVVGADGKPVMEKETFMTPIRNEDLTGPITFRVGLSRAFLGKSVVVTHVGHGGYETETIGPRNVLKDEDGNPYVELSFSHFSTAVFDMSEVREAAHTDTEATLGIAKVARPEAGGETAVGVPWVRSGVLTGEALPASELVTTGLRSGDTVRTWEASDATEAYAQLDMASGVRVAQGSAFWFGSGEAGAVPVTVSGLVSGQAETAVAAGSAERPAMTLLANPYRRDTLLAAAVAGAMAEGDQVVVEGGRIRLARKDGAWKVAERGAALGDSTDAKRLYGDTAWREATEQELRVPAGKAFWYVSRGGSPTVRW